MTTKQKTQTVDSELFLSMSYPVYIIEKKNGKQISKEAIDSEVVLKLLLSVISDAAQKLVDEPKQKPIKEVKSRAKKTR